MTKPKTTTTKPRRDQLREQASTGIVGSYFHTWTKDDGGQRVMHWQGVVLAEPRLGTYLVQIFSWADGRPTERHLVDFDDLRAWTLYPDGDEMEIAYGHYDRARTADLRRQHPGRCPAAAPSEPIPGPCTRAQAPSPGNGAPR
jgi:hypothetical protein